ncbi:hypothetical protein H5U35_00455, partial [Candidatus Aerophobetes bacterium]|nr:hypothetical protein [Candidatus Aerophobetes bacterium]
MIFKKLILRILLVILVAFICYSISFNMGKDPWMYTFLGGFIALLAVIVE